MNDDLLISLRKFKRSDKRDPIENFITEAFAWLLKTYPKYSDYLLKDLFLRLGNGTILPSNANWNTQVNFKEYILI